MTTVAHPGDSLSRRQRLAYVLMLGALVALGPFTIDLYLPAFPNVAGELGASDAAVQLTLTATTVGFGIGQLLVGPWSDSVGRRIPLLVATTVHVAASLGVAAAPDIEWVGVFRVLQGVGAAGGGVVAAAMVRDLFGGQPMVRMLARLALVTGLAPVLAPVIGSQLLRGTDWRGLFVVLAGYGALMLVLAVLVVRETLPPTRRKEPGHGSARERYRALFTDRVFLGVALMGGMQFSALFAYLASSSFLFQDVYGFDPQQYGLMFAVNSVGLVIGSQTSSRLMRRIGPQWILAVTAAVILLCGIAILVAGLVGAGWLGVAIPLFVLLTSAGFAFPTIQVLALAHHGNEAGTAASVLGAVNFGLAGAISPIIGLFDVTSPLPMAGVMIATMLIANTAMWVVVRPRTVPPIGD